LNTLNLWTFEPLPFPNLKRALFLSLEHLILGQKAPQTFHFLVDIVGYKRPPLELNKSQRKDRRPTEAALWISGPPKFQIFKFSNPFLLIPSTSLPRSDHFVGGKPNCNYPRTPIVFGKTFRELVFLIGKSLIALPILSESHIAPPS
jgi:hypothetical protein